MSLRGRSPPLGPEQNTALLQQPVSVCWFYAIGRSPRNRPPMQPAIHLHTHQPWCTRHCIEPIIQTLCMFPPDTHTENHMLTCSQYVGCCDNCWGSQHRKKKNFILLFPDLRSRTTRSTSILHSVEYGTKMIFYVHRDKHGGCRSASRAGRQVVGSLVQIPAPPGRAEMHVVVSLSKILNPNLLPMCSRHLAPWQPLPSVKGPTMSWRLVQEAPCPRPETAGIGSSTNPSDPIKGIKRLRTIDREINFFAFL